MADMPNTPEDITSYVADNDIRFIRFWFTDILGQLKSFSVNAPSSTTPSREAWASTARRSPASTRSRSRT